MTDHSKIATAVVGVGYVGKFHAEKYAASGKATLVAVADIDKERAESVAKSIGRRRVHGLSRSCLGEFGASVSRCRRAYTLKLPAISSNVASMF